MFLLIPWILTLLLGKYFFDKIVLVSVVGGLTSIILLLAIRAFWIVFKNPEFTLYDEK